MISPWSGTASLVSPDGRTSARIDDAGEIAMGAPTAGTLILSSGLTVDRCNPSMVWSDDSRRLAIPRWTVDRRQHLAIIDVHDGAIRELPEIYRVLQLESFEGGIVRGVDSPIYQPRAIAIRVG